MKMLAVPANCRVVSGPKDNNIIIVARNKIFSSNKIIFYLVLIF